MEALEGFVCGLIVGFMISFIIFIDIVLNKTNKTDNIEN